MPISLFETKNQTRTLTVEYAGKSADVIYYPHKVTKTLIREVAESDGDGIDKLIRQLELLIASWEVLGEDKKPLPPTAEVMAEFPLDFLTAIMRAINEAAIPGEGGGGT